MENRYGLYSQGSSGWTSMRNEEFQEADVWGVFKERKESDSDRINISSYKEPSFISRRLPAATRMIPISNKNRHTEEPRTVHHSAPVNIPDWSKINGQKNSPSRVESGSDNGKNDDDGFVRSSWESEEDDEEDDEGNVIPPHEWLARKLARSRISSFSVFEGAGRTLKGRDLSRVRNAVLSRTGFLESESNRY